MIPQGATLTARNDFGFKPQRKGARTINVRKGQRFWVTSPAYTQHAGVIVIDRLGKGSISNGYPFLETQVQELFEVAA